MYLVWINKLKGIICFNSRLYFAKHADNGTSTIPHLSTETKHWTSCRLRYIFVYYCFFGKNFCIFFNNKEGIYILNLNISFVSVTDFELKTLYCENIFFVCK